MIIVECVHRDRIVERVCQINEMIPNQYYVCLDN